MARAIYVAALLVVATALCGAAEAAKEPFMSVYDPETKLYTFKKKGKYNCFRMKLQAIPVSVNYNFDSNGTLLSSIQYGNVIDDATGQKVGVFEAVGAATTPVLPNGNQASQVETVLSLGPNNTDAFMAQGAIMASATTGSFVNFVYSVIGGTGAFKGATGYVQLGSNIQPSPENPYPGQASGERG
ncbi:hypothetical protein Rsub_07538 [Raphidocelis subcapitata]|uniref:Uncharacterized protein n=1 Tax=Raphidocelis subcapitata TaxID=307507 RepID=A0A2V0PCZ2_9CHLO|nr:hypothetical protein Rsub_07538 [Raphidocelis subcapitata]|eukprot:GBF95037.1 hypothetical protein Rsub_07538 [Raphidocelis subcapitata]